MKKVLIIFAVLCLFACSSDNANDSQNPDASQEVQNTGMLLSLDGGNLHIAYTYDEFGRVTTAEQSRYSGTVMTAGQSKDSGKSVEKRQAVYQYDDSHIYITYQEYEELANGKHNPLYSRDFIRHDTLFIVSNHVDSCAGTFVNERTRFFYKFSYNKRGELIFVKNDNVLRDYTGKLMDKPFYSERITLDWENGNVIKKTTILPISRDTTEWFYQYSSLYGVLEMNDPRFILEDFAPLLCSGYFGVHARNLLWRVENGGSILQNDYELDAMNLLKSMKSTITWGDNHVSTTEYSIEWKP